MRPPSPDLDDARVAFDRIAAGTLCGVDAGVRDVALACGYTAAEVVAVPAAAILGLGCGHPVAAADLQPGETVADIGCGGGFDVLLAACRVGPGRVIGFDLSPPMIDRANLHRRPSAEFRAGNQEAIPLPDASVDCVLSNGAFRYARRKKDALRELFRVLKPGGRLCLCDLAWKSLPPAALWDDDFGPAVCGLRWMLTIEDLEVILPDRGFTAVRATPTAFDLRAYARPAPPPDAMSDAARLARWEEASLGCCGIDAEPASPFHDGFATLLRKHDLGAYVTAVEVHATKPGGGSR